MSPERRAMDAATPAEAAARQAAQAARPGGPCADVHCPHAEPDPACAKAGPERRQIAVCCRCGSRA